MLRYAGNSDTLTGLESRAGQKINQRLTMNPVDNFPSRLTITPQLVNYKLANDLSVVGRD